MNLEQFKLATKEELKSYGLTIPLSETYDSNNNELTHKNSTGDWYEKTYDINNNQLTCKDSNNFWSERTYDSNNNELTHKNSTGDWHECTYDANNNLLTFKDSDGFDGIFLYKGCYTLYWNKTNSKYKAGCQELTYEKCLAYYNKHKDKHKDADKMLEAIKKHHNA